MARAGSIVLKPAFLVALIESLAQACRDAQVEPISLRPLGPTGFSMEYQFCWPCSKVSCQSPLRPLPTTATAALRNRMAYHLDTTDPKAPSPLRA